MVAVISHDKKLKRPTFFVMPSRFYSESGQINLCFPKTGCLRKKVYEGQTNFNLLVQLYFSFSVTTILRVLEGRKLNLPSKEVS